MTAVPLKAFILLTAFGRMPGTLVLSLQGALLFDGDYLLVALVVLALCGLTSFAYKYKQKIYQWVERSDENGLGGS